MIDWSTVLLSYIQIIQMERSIHQTLDFKLVALTPYSFLQH